MSRGRRLLFVVTLFALLPFTMAPRTSDGDVELRLEVLTSTTSVTEGVPVPIVVHVTRVGAGTAALTPVTIDVAGGSTVAAEDITVVSQSRACGPPSGLPVTCNVGHVWQSAVVRLVVVSSESGTFVPAVSSPYATNL